MKLKTHDKVLVIAGKDKGKKGEIMKLMVKQDKLIVKDVNIRTKHIKKSATKPGERIKFEAGVNVSNVALLCPNCSKPTRVGYMMVADKKQRICKKCKQPIDQKVESVKIKPRKKS